jgi:hypothetical protein
MILRIPHPPFPHYHGGKNKCQYLTAIPIIGRNIFPISRKATNEVIGCVQKGAQAAQPPQQAGAAEDRGGPRERRKHEPEPQCEKGGAGAEHQAIEPHDQKPRGRKVRGANKYPENRTKDAKTCKKNIFA